MYYQVSKEFFEKLPNACFGAVAVRGLDNTHDIPELEQMLAENVTACEAYFTGKKPKETEDILPYRQAFTSLGINPNKFLCSIEALLTRIAKGKGFPHINAAVDLGNAVSIKHRLPMGAHDLDTIDEGLDVRLAREGDTFIPFGSTEEETPDVGEAVYASGSEIRTRRWTWRQSERGKITEATRAILFPIDGFSDVNAGEVQAAADEVGGTAAQVFRRQHRDRDRHSHQGSSPLRLLPVSAKKNRPPAVLFHVSFPSSSASAPRSAGTSSPPARCPSGSAALRPV